MTSQEHARAVHRSTIWIADHIDLRYASDRELLQIIAQQPANVWHGSARALAARWEARRRGLRAIIRQPQPRHRYVQQPEPDALLVSLILDNPGAPDLPAGRGEPQPSEESDDFPTVQAPQSQPRHRYVQQPEPDTLLVSLILDDPGAPNLPAGRGE